MRGRDPIVVRDPRVIEPAAPDAVSVTPWLAPADAVGVTPWLTRLLCAALLGACCTGCALSRAPARWLPNVTEARTEARGGWAYLERAHRAGAGGSAMGELLAVSRDSIFLEGHASTDPQSTQFPAPPRLIAVALSEVTSGRLETYDPAVGGVALLSLLGVMSTVSNGILLVGTAPMWFLGGTGTAMARSREPLLRFPGDPLPEWSRFARYPQGLPSAFGRGGF